MTKKYKLGLNAKEYVLGLNDDSAIYCVTDNIWINKNPKSRHYQAYLEWLGNTPVPASEG